MLGQTMLGEGRCDEAAGHFRHIIDREIKDKVGHLLFLARGYQALGNHEKALGVLNTAEALGVLEGPNKKVYNKMRKVSEKNPYSNEPYVGRAGRIVIGDGKKVHESTREVSEKDTHSKESFAERARRIIGYDQKEVKKRRRRSQKIAVAAVLFLILFIYLAVAFVKGNATDVYFVNGLSKVYSVKVNGQTRRLAPMRAMRFAMPEGVIRVEAVDGGPDIPAQEHRVKTNFFARPFVNKAWVINPDGVAPIVREKIWYAVRQADAREGEQELHFGETFYCFGGIDYPFEAFPEEIRTEGKRTVRTGLSVLDDALSQDYMFEIVSEHLGPAAGVVYAKNHMLYEPEEDKYVGLYASIAPPKEFLETVKAGLDVRPVRINWHRVYQGVCDMAGREGELVEEYRERLEEEPNDAALHYLLGRVVADYDEAVSCFEKAVSGASPCPCGYLGLAYRCASMGRYAEGLELINKGLARDGGNEFFLFCQVELHEALGRWDEVVKYWEEEHSEDPNSFALFHAYAGVLASSGQGERAKRLVGEWVKRFSVEVEAEELETLENMLRSHVLYCMGDLEGHAERAGRIDLPLMKAMCAVARGTGVDANTVEGVEDAYVLLTLYLSEEKPGRSASAARCLSKATEILSHGDSNERRLSGYLNDESAPEAEEACSLVLDNAEKRVVLAVLGLKFREDREVYFELGEKLNFDRSFPHLFLKDLFGGKDVSPDLE
jgi:tetratricopeptide (TPR) repeat protein